MNGVRQVYDPDTTPIYTPWWVNGELSLSKMDLEGFMADAPFLEPAHADRLQGTP